MERHILTRRSDGAPCGIELRDNDLTRSPIWQEVVADQTRRRLIPTTHKQKDTQP
jgi:hypothetical protein